MVLPNYGLLDRQLDVTVLVADLDLTDTPSVEFGPGITVTSVRVAGEDAIRARLAVAFDAELGLRDAVVTSGDTRVVGTGAFEVRPALEVVPTYGKPIEQGSYTALNFINHDEVGFETTIGSNISWIPTTWIPTLRVAANGIGSFYAGYTTGKFIMAGCMVAPLAPPGPQQITLTNLYGGEPVISFHSAPDGVNIVAREPEVMLEPIKSGLTFPEREMNRLLKYTLDGPFMGFVTVTASAPYESVMSPLVLWYGDTGLPDSYLGYFGAQGTINHGPWEGSSSMPFALDGPEDMYFVARDWGGLGSPKFQMTLRIDTFPTQSVREAGRAHRELPGIEIGDACAPSGALVPCVVSGDITDTDEVDVYSLSGITSPVDILFSVRGPTGLEAWMQPGVSETVDAAITSSVDFFGNLQPVVVDEVTMDLGAAFDRADAYYLVVRGGVGVTGKYVIGIQELL